MTNTSATVDFGKYGKYMVISGSTLSSEQIDRLIQEIYYDLGDTDVFDYQSSTMTEASKEITAQFNERNIPRGYRKQMRKDLLADIRTQRRERWIEDNTDC